MVSDGNPTPKAHDGMAAFALPNSNISLIRNHEDRNSSQTATVKGDPTTAYDALAGGSNTSLEIRVNPDGTRELIRDFISINGTFVNCAGGATPFGPEGGVWLTCEETTDGTSPFVPDSQGRPFRGSNGFNQPNGFVFEVPVLAEGPSLPVALTEMARFSHEAVTVDPARGIVYETEDDGASGFYGFLPNDPNNLQLGGKLQMLAIKNRPNYDTCTGQTIPRSLPVVWVDIDNPNPPEAETNSDAVFEQGLAKGGAIFTRLEGCWFGNGSVFFNATDGGDAGLGQVWEYRPTGNPNGTLRLIFESPSADLLDSPDNITVSPRGGLVLCEDGGGEQLIRGLTPNGMILDFAINLVNDCEWVGATFGPDGQTLFVNIQGDTRGPDTVPSSLGDIGMTFAIWGPFEIAVL